MRQKDVLEFLEKNKKKWFTAKEIRNNIIWVNRNDLYSTINTLKYKSRILCEQRKIENTMIFRWHYKHKEN